MKFEYVDADDLGEPVTCSCQGVPFVQGLTRAEMGKLTAAIAREFGDGSEVCLHIDGALSVASEPGAARVGIRATGEEAAES